MAQEGYRYGDSPKYPGAASGLPPSPTIFNPGRVFPKTDPAKASTSSLPRLETPIRRVGNPFLMINALDDLDRAFRNVITILEEENVTRQPNEYEDPLLLRFRNWRDALERIRRGDEASAQPTPDESAMDTHEGGMFTD
ncbi:hypothetical protein BDN70DRAFT_876111 [Pholiota conissans]|uniref:Uncharacterized protein n=1 Tax=Pholiota conissans TaxID=109636 RepID=A0A9P5Z6B8_9AGAR|nr:hypothetical protein BDN70DRAFT_876111 [Pholiota conissans]